MKSLKESILADMDDVISAGNEGIKRYEAIGYMFTFSRGISSTKAAGVFSVKSLKKLNKDIDYINDNIRPGKIIFDNKDKCNMFLNWFENLTFDELGIDIFKYNSFDSIDFHKDLTKSLRELCKKHDIFNSPNKVDMYILKARDYDKDALFEIFISDRTTYSASNMMKFVYKKR